MHFRLLVVSLLLLVGASGAFAMANKAGASAPANAAQIEGKVVETMNSGGYTYLRVESGAKQVWVAAPELSVKVGDRVAISGGMPMTNFRSKTLNRTFDAVHFANGVTVNGKPAAPLAGGADANLPAGHPPTASAKDGAKFDFSNIKRAPNGKTVAEVYAGGAAQAGKKVAVRGRVVKYNGGILGKNWLHIRDGSGTEGTNDLTVTTKGTAKVGDLVLVEGVLAANRDFGGGYKYGLILEDAKVTVE